jgi:DNA-binding MarR family transcriptional regulator
MAARPSVRSATEAELLTALETEIRQMTALAVLFSHGAAERLGMNSTDLETLDILVLNGRVTAGRLAELSGLTTGAVTRLVDRLEEAGMVRREPDPRDRRRVYIALCEEEAARRVGDTFAAMQRAMLALWATFSAGELETVLRFLRECNAVAREQVALIREPIDGESAG